MEPVDVRDLLADPGGSRRVRRSEALEGLAVELAEVAAEDRVQADLLLESVVEGVLVSGPLTGRMRYRCARCLTTFESEFRVEVTELFSPGASEDDEAYPVTAEGALDLEPMVRDAVVLSMPFSPLCREDCQGLCDRCGGDRNLGECTCRPEPDPRWAALESLELE